MKSSLDSASVQFIVSWNPAGDRYFDDLARESIEGTAKLRSAILEVDHPQTELVLTRQCADVSKLT